MQPTLVVTAAHPGIISINGHFAGELSAGQPLIRPINAWGPVYLDYRPLDNSCLPLARKLVFSGGAPMAESCEACADASIVLWPNSVTELELTPRRSEASQLSFSRGGYNFTLSGGAEPVLFCEGRQLATLPEGAQLPDARNLLGGTVLFGPCNSGMYLLSTDREFRSATGLLLAQQIEIEPNDAIRATLHAGDSVGHGMQESWQLTPTGLQLTSSEGIWTGGAPHWPQTPEATALAAVEAALSGLHDEAEAYLSPQLRGSHPLEAMPGACDLCVPMKYLPSGARPCVGLLRLLGGNLARVEPLYFRAVASDGKQGPYWIDAFEYT